MNKLQTVIAEIGTENDKVYRDLLASLKDGLSVDDAFTDVEYLKRVKENFADGVVASMNHGTWQTALVLDGPKARDWYLFTDHQGGALSDTIRTSGAKAAVKNVLKDAFTFKTSVQDIAKKLPTVGQDGKLPNAMVKLVEDYKRLPKGHAKISASIRRLEVDLLSGEPTQLKASYRRLLSAVEKGSDQLVENALSNAVNKKLKYINERIARTEVARAYNMSTNRAYKEDPRVIGWRWLLSPMHPVFDVCDYCADADIFGMGAGVYPVGDGPSIPAHPNCLCMSEPVLKRSDRKVGRASKEREADARQQAVDTGYSEKRLNKEIQALENNTRNMIPKTLVRKK